MDPADIKVTINPPEHVSEAPKIERICREDLSLSNYQTLPGGPFGRQNRATIHHPTLGDRDFATPLPMSEEAILDFVALFTTVQGYKSMPVIGGGIEENVPQEKPQGLWEGDAAEGPKAALAAKRASEECEE